MGGTRALIASLGASISLVAGAALSLLALSFIFAYDGLAGATDDRGSRGALVLDAPTTPTRDLRDGPNRARPALVIEAPAAPARKLVPVVATVPAPARELTADRSEAPARRPKPATSTIGPVGAAPPPPAPKAAKPAPAAGDGVRDLGEAVGTTVDQTGDGVAGAVTTLLGPPVSEAVQDVLEAVSQLLQRTTGALGGTLDVLKK